MDMTKIASRGAAFFFHTFHFYLSKEVESALQFSPYSPYFYLSEYNMKNYLKSQLMPSDGVICGQLLKCKHDKCNNNK